MKHCFILDENVIAQTQNPSLAKQTICLLALIKTNCHMIALDATLNIKLHRWLTQRDRKLGNIFPTGPTFLRSVLTDAKKQRWVDTQPALTERGFIHHPNDWYLVDLAVSCKNVHFVSTGDSATRNSFNHPEFGKIGIDGITVAQAIEFARDH